MSEYVKATERQTLLSLLEEADKGTIALPGFQRDLVWGPADTIALLTSLSWNHPAGSILLLETPRLDSTDSPEQSPAARLNPRAIEGAPQLTEASHISRLILDGQQRLSSLYRALHGIGDYLYYLDLGAAMDAGDDLEQAGVFFALKGNTQSGKDYQRRIELESVEGQRNKRVFPLRLLIDAGVGEWITQVVRTTETREEEHELREWLEEATAKYVGPIEKYQFPFVLLDATTPLTAVCQIFEDLNKRGKRLGVFDLAVAVHYHSMNLRDRWEAATESYGDGFSRIGVEPVHVLECVSLLASLARSSLDATGPEAWTASCNRGAVLSLASEEIETYWDFSVEALNQATQWLADDLGVHREKWLPYKTMLVPLASTLALEFSKSGKWPGVELREAARQWFWFSCFTQAYDQGARSRQGLDFVHLARFMDAGILPPAWSSVDVDEIDLRSTTPRQQAVYKAAIAAIVADSPKDLASGATIPRGQVGAEDGVQDHHIFPKNHLRKSVSATLRDCVLNRTLIDQETNNLIKDKAPSDYLPAYWNQPTGPQIFESHMLPPGDGPIVNNDDFEGFLAWREERLRKRIASLVSPAS